MAKELRYDGKVAIVTGAGGGLGRAYAILLGSRGAKVVVNDLGGSFKGEGTSTSMADKVVNEIKAMGGEAIANYDSVEFGEKIVQTALDKWGRVDIIINNAGILRDISLQKMSQKDWDLIYAVHMKGTYSVTKAAWNVMRDQKYGRIINVSSAAGLYGNFGQTNYSAMKMAIAGFSLAAAKEGASRNIKVNVIAPIAGSRMTETVMPPDLLEKLRPEYVAPFVGYLAHESCAPTGGIFELGAGWVAKVRWQRSKGSFFNIKKGMTVEDVAEKYPSIEDFSSGATYPTATNDAFEPIMANLAKL